MDLPEGSELGRFYVPGECDVSIRPGWFWRAAENARVKSPRTLLRLYEASVGRNCNLLLNVPPDDRGLIHDNDVKALAGMRALVDRVYGTSLMPAVATATASSVARRRGGAAAYVLDTDLDTWWAPAGEAHAPAASRWTWARPSRFDRVRLQEYVALGQRVSLFEIEAFVDGAWTRIATGTTIGHTRIVATAVTTTSRVRVTIRDARGVPMLASLSLHDSSRPTRVAPTRRRTDGCAARSARPTLHSDSDSRPHEPTTTAAVARRWPRSPRRSSRGRRRRPGQRRHLPQRPVPASPIASSSSRSTACGRRRCSAGSTQAILQHVLGPKKKVEEHPLYKTYWRETREARREALMPFLWGTFLKQHGSIVGDHRAGSVMTLGQHASLQLSGVCGADDRRAA